MVARTHNAPSSKCGMNSPPMKGINNRVAPKIREDAKIVNFVRSRHQANYTPQRSLTHSNAFLRFSRTPFLNQYEHITGTKVSVKISAPTSATDMVSAIG